MAIIDELGIGTAGRGDDFNYILRRANPALGLARKVIAILDRSRSAARRSIDATNTIAAQAAGTHPGGAEVPRPGGALTSLTAAHSDNLSQSIARLPGLLAAAQPALTQLDTVAVREPRSSSSSTPPSRP